MKFLNERTEIATAINCHKYPVVKIDLSEMDEYGLKGAKVLIDFGKFNNGAPWYEHAEIRAFRDEKKLTFCSYGCCVAARFGYHEMDEMLEYANAPLIKPESEMLVCFVDSKRRTAFAPVVLKTGKISKHCSTPISVEEFGGFYFEAMGVEL